MDYHREKKEPPEQMESEISEENSDMMGSFDGDSEEQVQWDGSEAELVADDDAAEYEDQNTGIKLSYILTQDEIFSCLKESGICKTTGRRAVVESIILGALFLLFGCSYFMGHDKNALVFAAISLLLIPIIWLVPYFGIKKRARELADGKEIEIEIYPDVIEIGNGEGYWEIPLDGTCECAQFSNLFVFYPSGNRMLVLPLRCIEPAVIPEIHAMILAGTRLREE